jgi:hypothetical protein
MGDSTVTMEIRFRGVTVNPSRIYLTNHGGPGSASGFGGDVLLTATLRDEVVEPKAQLKTIRTELKPKNSPVCAPLNERDVAPDGCTSYAMVLEYSYACDEPIEVCVALVWLHIKCHRVIDHSACSCAERNAL